MSKFEEMSFDDKCDVCDNKIIKIIEKNIKEKNNE